MRFKQLKMKDFRGVRELSIDFEPDLTVIVGRNGAGKTSILDALATFARLFRDRRTGELPLVQLDDGWQRSLVDFPEPPGGWHRHADSELDSGDVRWSASLFELSLEYGPDEIFANPAKVNVLKIIHPVRSKVGAYVCFEEPQRLSRTDRTGPHFIYYRQNRGFQQDADSAYPAADRTSGSVADRTFDPEYVQNFSLAEDLRAIGDLETWWNERDADEARIVRDANPDHRDPQLEAIRKLVTRIDGFAGIKYSSTDSPPGLRLLKTDDAAVHVSALSGGERSYIILLADLARRLQVFAPDQPLDKIDAVVLVDEIELNLHPAWQSQIVPTLTDVFKQCQFIVTTHSPQVLSGIESRNVRILQQTASGETEVTTPLSTRGRTSNYLLEGVLGASERYPPIDAMVDDFNEAIDQGDLASAEKKFARIEAEISDDAPTLLVLRKRLRNLGDGG